MQDWRGDNLNRQTGLAHLTERMRSFIWLCISQFDYEYLNKDPLKSSRDEIYGALTRSPLALQLIRNGNNAEFLANQHLDWLTDNKWQSEWVRKTIVLELARIGVVLQFNPSIHLSGKQRSVALFDYLVHQKQCRVDMQLVEIDRLKASWLQQMNFDKKLNWLISDSARKHFQGWLGNQMIPAPPFDDIEDALIFVNRNSPHPMELRDLIDRARKSWSQLQRREKSKHKKQCNFELSTTTIQKLDILAKKYGISRTEIIEIIINAESINQYHINNILKNRQRLIDSIDNR